MQGCIAFIQEDNKKTQVKEWLYRKNFNEEFNYGFGFPCSDICEMCDLLKVAIDSTESEMERHTLQVELSTHQKKAAQGYQSLRLDTKYSRTDTNSLVLAI